MRGGGMTKEHQGQTVNEQERHEQVASAGMNRRNFIKLAGTSALSGMAATTILPKLAQADVSPSRFPSQDLWDWVQRQFIVNEDRVYMNIGTTGSMPKHVLDRYDELNRIVARDPWAMEGEFGDKWPYSTPLRQALAPQFGADHDEIVITGNTTMGMNITLAGLDFQKGDVILTTNQEHIAATSSLALLQDRYGVKVIEIPLPTEYAAGKGEITRLFDQWLRKISFWSRPKLLVFSHITYTTGLRLPARDICKRARRYGIPTLIDGAHASGMLDLDFTNIGCDFYAASGHKWQCGPGGTGIFYVSKDAPTLWPILSSVYEFTGRSDIGLALQYHGNPNYPAMQALVDSCSFWDKIGRKRIEDRVLELSSYCKQEIQKAFPKAHLYCPNIPEISSGLTTFNPFKNVYSKEKVKNFRDALRERHKFIIRYTHFKANDWDTQDTYALRISTHIFNDKQQINNLIHAMVDVFQTLSL